MRYIAHRSAAYSFGPIMAAAETTTVVQVAGVVPVGRIGPEHVVTRCIYVERVVRVTAPSRSV